MEAQGTAIGTTMIRPLARLLILTVILMITRAGLSADLHVEMADPELELISIDSDPKESFLAVHLDTAGRSFVGCREAVFVYEPDARGGYRPRQELVRFPPHSWVYDVEARGHDVYALTTTALSTRSSTR